MRHLWSQFLCWWKGHTFTPGDFTTDEDRRITILHILRDSSCVRCGRSFADLWNDGGLR